MLAEINNKGIRDAIYSEDELTGHFFGNLRYLPFMCNIKDQDTEMLYIKTQLSTSSLRTSL